MSTKLIIILIITILGAANIYYITASHNTLQRLEALERKPVEKKRKKMDMGIFEGGGEVDTSGWGY